MDSTPQILRLDRAEADRVSDVMSEAFYDYPVTRYVLRDALGDYDRRLRRLVNFFVMARVLREAVWADLGNAARARYEAFGRAWEPLDAREPHIHLNMIGVRRACRGRGFARVLLDHVQEMSRRTEGSRGVSLTTEDPGNVPMYEHVGYEVVAHARIAPELETWSMFRRG
jgi:GNAT superfamily N-acetyltransferase